MRIRGSRAAGIPFTRLASSSRLGYCAVDYALQRGCEEGFRTCSRMESVHSRRAEKITGMAGLKLLVNLLRVQSRLNKRPVARYQSRVQASGVAHPQRSGRSVSSYDEDWAADAVPTDRPDRREPRCAADHRVQIERRGRK